MQILAIIIRTPRENAFGHAWRVGRLVAVSAWVLGMHAVNAQSPKEWLVQRKVMIDEDIVKAGIVNQRVVHAMWATPRHEFIPNDQQKYAYFDMALPIGEQQTISPPFIVASMTERLDPTPADSVLEVGTGSGYQAAVLSSLVRDVYTIEIVEPLGRRAKATLEVLGYKNVHAKIGDGYAGWPEHSPFDKIIVTCNAEQVPQPLVEQLREGGRLIVPLGERFQQMLHVMKKVDGKLVVESREPTFFVPMTGTAEGQRSAEPVAAITSLVNGDFEHIADGQPAGWYYVRSCNVVPCDLAGQSGPDGHCLSFTNSVPGRACQSLQAFGVDGRQVSELEARVWVRSEDACRGVVAEQQPRLIVNFCDANRVPVGQGSLGPWLDTSDWKHETGRMAVPLQARMATIGVGLLGGTGKLLVDAVEVDVSQRR